MAIYIFPLTTLWEEIVEHFGYYLAQDADGDKTSMDENGNTAEEIALCWLSKLIFKETGGYCASALLLPLPLATQLAMDFSQDTLLLEYSTIITHFFTSTQWKLGTDISLRVHCSSLYIEAP